MIYDLFQFSHELDLLEIRLNTLWDVVDKFVILESEYSHTKKYKGLYYKTNEKHFDKYKDKIIYFNYNILNYENPWGQEMTYREVLWEKIKGKLKLDDIILHGDCDEIPNPEVLKDVIKNLERPTTLLSDYFYFCLDLWGRYPSPDTFIIKPDWKTAPMWELRSHRTNFKYEGVFKHIPKAGWHYSSVGTPENIQKKMMWFAHAPEQDQNMMTETVIIESIKNKRGGISSHEKNNNQLKLIDLNYDTAPKFIVDNKKEYEHLMYNFYAG